MQIVIISDIFGKTKALKKLAAEISSSAIILEPYGSAYKNFKDENAAYTYFQRSVGLEEYSKQVMDYLLQNQKETVLIGFSIGAAVIWNISNSYPGQNSMSGICFYGSQIRHKKESQPKFPLRLLFPKEEKHFDLSILIETIERYENVQVKQLPYLHGFMNTYSKNFDTVGFIEGLRIIKSAI